jgi:CRISPR/Cas system-associated protein Cas10 (large subunit of type III CRISPR-Cas system)
MEITCGKCGTVQDTGEFKIFLEDKMAKGHPVSFPCKKCGALVQIGGTTEKEEKDKTLEMFDRVKQLLPEISRIIQEFRRSKISGADTGIGEAVARMSRELSLEVIQEDPLIREGLKDLVREELRAAFLPKEEEEGGEEVES